MKNIVLSPVAILAIIRWIILLLMIGFVSLQHGLVPGMPLLLALFTIFGLSNIILMLLPPSTANGSWIYPATFLLDIGFVTLTTYLILGWKTDLLLIYFVIVFMAATQQSLRMVFAVALVASALYLTRRLGDMTEIAWADAQTVLAVPAFFIVALFTGFLSQQSRKATAVLGEERRRTESFRQSALRESGRYKSERGKVEELETQDKQKNNYLESVTHEYRTVLASVRGYCELLLNQTIVVSEKERRHGLVGIRRNVVRLERLAEKVFTMLDLEKGQLAIYKDSVDIKNLADDCNFFMENVSSTHPFEVRIEGNNYKLNCDFLRISLVLWILLTNAVQFSPKGGLVTLQIIRKQRYLTMRVTDQGIGIAEHDTELVFEKYWQGSHIREKNARKSGMGLYLAREIVSLHGGTLDVASFLGKGTTFTCILPIS